MLNRLKGLFKGKKAKDALPKDAADGDTADGADDAAGKEPEESSGKQLSKAELKAAKKTEKAAAKAAKAAEKAAKKAKANAAKPPKPPKPKPVPKAAKTPKPKKPKLTKEQKIQIERERLIAKTKLKVEKLRAKGAKRAEKIRLRTERITEKKRIKKEFKAEKKQFEKSLRDEIKQAKKDMPKSNLPKIIIPVVLVLLLAASAVVTAKMGIGPLGSFKMPEMPGFVKAIGEFKPLERLRAINPLSSDSKKAEDALENMFASLQSLDFKEAEKYIDISALTVPEGYLELVSSDTVRNCTFDRLEFSILSGPDEISDNEFEALVNVTAIDIKPLMATFIREYLQMTYDATQSQSPSQLGIAGTTAFFSDIAANPDLATVDNEVTVNIQLIDGAWMVVPDNNLINALYGGVIIVAGDFFAPDGHPDGSHGTGSEEPED